MCEQRDVGNVADRREGAAGHSASDYFYTDAPGRCACLRRVTAPCNLITHVNREQEEEEKLGVFEAPQQAELELEQDAQQFSAQLE